MLSISILGLTCRLDVTELLEKRVKSRFSHRYVYLSEEITFPDLLSALLFYLKFPPSYCKRKSSIESQWNKRIGELMADPLIKDSLLFMFNLSSDINAIKQLATLLIGRCSQSNQLPEQKHFLETFKVLDVDSKAAMLQGLSSVSYFGFW